jgi:hypothetical protein
MIESVFSTVIGALAVMSVVGLIWLYYSHRNHLINYEEYKTDQDEYIADKLKIERLETEKQALELKSDYNEKFNALRNQNAILSSTMENYIKRSVQVDEEQTESIKELRDLIINQLLSNGRTEKTRM